MRDTLGHMTDTDKDCWYPYRLFFSVALLIRLMLALVLEPEDKSTGPIYGPIYQYLCICQLLSNKKLE